MWGLRSWKRVWNGRSLELKNGLKKEVSTSCTTFQCECPPKDWTWFHLLNNSLRTWTWNCHFLYIYLKHVFTPELLLIWIYIYVCYKSYSFDLLSFLHTFTFQVLVTPAIMLSHISLSPMLVSLSFFFFYFSIVVSFWVWSLYFYDIECFYWSAGKVCAINCLLCSIKLADDASANLNVSTGMKRHLQLTHQLICWFTGDNTVGWKMCKGKLKYMQYGTCGSPRIVSTKDRLETVRSQPHHKEVDGKRRNYLTSAVTKLFLLNHQLVFCCSHPTSSGIYAGNHYSLETCRMNMLIKCTTALK